MKAAKGKEVRGAPNRGADRSRVPGLDEQLCQLIETVYACERRRSVEDRIEAALSMIPTPTGQLENKRCEQ